jgi:hypothetical protein
MIREYVLRGVLECWSHGVMLKYRKCNQIRNDKMECAE